MATTPGWRTRTRSPRRRPARRRRPRSSRPAASRAPGTAAGRAWDLDELEWDSHGNLDVRGRLATDRPVVAKFYGSYRLPFGTQIGGFVYAGSGTPMSTVVNTTNTIPGAGQRPRRHGPHADAEPHRPARLARDRRAGGRRVRFELNVINLFNQKTATHIFNSLNKGAGLARADSAIDLSGTDLAKGYDYNALILASPSGANAFDPRYGKADLWQAGHAGSVQHQVPVLNIRRQCRPDAVIKGGSAGSPLLFCARSTRLLVPRMSATLAG